MLSHVSIGVADLARAHRFSDAALAPLGYTCLSAGSQLGYGRESPQLWVAEVKHPVAPDPASGLHVCFDAPTRASVEAFHAASLAAGGHNNGAPGLRADYGPNYYAAFIVDPDGYRIEAYCGKSG